MKTFSLQSAGFSNYYIDECGNLYKDNKQIQTDKNKRFYLIDDNNKAKRVTLKTIYRKIFNKEFSRDNIKDLKGEQWKEVPNTNGLYFVSNCGRIKSLNGYNTIILQTYEKQNGYLVIKIKGKNEHLHRLVAFAFCENKYKGQKVEVHHKDKNKKNNHSYNLEILSIDEHKKRHKKKESVSK